MKLRVSLTLILSPLLAALACAQPSERVIPKLQHKPAIDGALDEWKDKAYSDGKWNLDRAKASSWYQPKRNRLTVEDSEAEGEIDLEAEYFIAYDDEFMYLGAKVVDNINDVTDSKHEPKRWYYKDAIAWFIESPRDTISEKFGNGDHGLAFVIDKSRPDYGAWWRRGSATENYIETPLPVEAHDYSIRFAPSANGKASYVLEARIKLDLLGIDPKTDDDLGMMIVHCDPDGAEYGGHLLIYGQGDDDNTWSNFELGSVSKKKEPLNVQSFGATSDRNKLSTSAFQEAIDSAYFMGGGIVNVPQGEYTIGTIVLKKNVTLHLEEDAIIYASRNVNDYKMPLEDAIRPTLVYANGAENISITGEGIIDGLAEHTYEDLRKTDNFIKDITENARSSGVEMKQYYVTPPDVALLVFKGCSQVKMEGITFRNSPFWNINLVRSQGILIDGIKVFSSLEKGVNSDGIDINSSRNVVVKNCTVQTGDDAIAVKTWYPEASENILVKNCLISSSSTGLKIGTETYGPIKNVEFTQCVVENTNRGISIVARDGGHVEAISFNNLEIECKRRHFNWWGNGDPIWIYATKRNKKSELGSIGNIEIVNVKASGMGTSRIESDYPDILMNVRLRNVEIEMTAESEADKRADHALLVRNAERIMLHDVSIKWEEENIEPKWRSALKLENTDDIRIENFSGRQGIAEAYWPTISLENTELVRIYDSAPYGPTSCFVQVKGADSKRMWLKNLDPEDLSKNTVLINDDVIDRNTISLE